MIIKISSYSTTTTRTKRTTKATTSIRSLQRVQRHQVVLSVLFILSSFSSFNLISTVSALKIMSSLPDSIKGTIPSNLDTLVEHANSYASANGIQVERRHSKEETKSYYECAPMSLLPNAYPKDSFLKAKRLAPAFNLLVDKISRDNEFLQSTLGGGVSEMDPYTGKLLQLYNQIYTNDPNNVAHTADRLGIQRSDYMLHNDDDNNEYQIKQVELNTIAASFAGLSSNIASLHQYLASRFSTEISSFIQSNEDIMSSATTTTSKDNKDIIGVQENPNLIKIPMGMKVAYDRYVTRFMKDDKDKPIILFVVQDGETNTVDQRMLEFRLWEDHQIPVIRMSLTKLSSQLQTTENGALLLNNREIAVVYYRAGYAPTDYPNGYDGIEWKAREQLESSRSVKCPSLGYHLAGTKKVQQELVRPGILERFFPNPSDKDLITDLRSTFAGLYSLDIDATTEDLNAVKDIIINGKEENYVLKPQREGGGYNYYGKELATKLKDNTEVSSNDDIKIGKVLAEFILMQRLFPPEQPAILLRNGKVEGCGPSISELGCFGTIVVSSDSKEVIHNDYAGFLLRTKFSGVDEGGVAAGFATLSSPYLC